MAVKILIRRATAAEWTSADPTLAQGELGYETDTQKLKMGDGSTAWTSLAYTGATDPIVASAITARGQIFTGSDSTDYAVLSIGTSGQILIEDPVAGTLTYQSVTLDSLPGVNTTSPTTGNLFARGASEWGMTTFSTELTASEETVRQVIANANMVNRTYVGVAGYAITGSATAKWSFPTDAASLTTSPPSFSTNNAGFANPAVAGYSTRGYFDLPIYKWSFPADTVASTTSFAFGFWEHAGFSNPAVAGYFSQGQTSSAVGKLTFPGDTVSTTTSSPADMNAHAGFANPAVAGYFSRGSNTSTVYKWTFPGDTVSTTTAAPTVLTKNAGMANPYVAGYFTRGNETNIVYKWSFPTDSVSTTTSAPSDLDYTAHPGFANPTVAGYFTKYYIATYKWSFPTDTVSTTTSAPDYIGAQGSFANA